MILWLFPILISCLGFFDCHLGFRTWRVIINNRILAQIRKTWTLLPLSLSFCCAMALFMFMKYYVLHKMELLYLEKQGSFHAFHNELKILVCNIIRTTRKPVSCWAQFSKIDVQSGLISFHLYWAYCS